ncbi:MAG TPA: enoyl-CoA hydratase-related protein [Rhizorhapis sp.]|nr:enoyl-CoA hydratase-related protein [Rhizorhapis sp.]
MSSVEMIRSGHVLEVRLNRPAALNAIDDDMERLLATAWATVDGDPDIWVALLTGAGDRAFCAGGDMKNPPRGHSGLSLGGGLTGIGGRLRSLSKPLIAAVHGHVLGLGFELAMCADIIIAAQDAIFRLPEARAGVIDHCGVVHRAVRQLPHHVAMGMVLASEPLPATDAWRFGLINQCVPREALDDAAQSWTARLLACSPLVARAAKQAVQQGLGVPLSEALGRTYTAIEEYRTSDDQSEAEHAWKLRRQPIWCGR